MMWPLSSISTLIYLKNGCPFRGATTGRVLRFRCIRALGPMMEENLRRAMKISLGDQMLLITRPILRRLPVLRRRAARRQTLIILASFCQTATFDCMMISCNLGGLRPAQPE
jgi:hypothetical protein